MDNPSLVVNCGNPQITLNCQEENRNTITKCNENITMQQKQLNQCKNELRSCQARLILKNVLCVHSANQNGNNTETTAIRNDINVTSANSQSTNYSAPIVNQNERISNSIGPETSILLHQNTSIFSSVYTDLKCLFSRKKLEIIQKCSSTKITRLQTNQTQEQAADCNCQMVMFSLTGLIILLFIGFCIFVLRRFWIPRKCCPVQSRLIEHRVLPADENIDKQNVTPSII